MGERRPLTSALSATPTGVDPQQMKSFVTQNNTRQTSKSRLQPVGLIPVTVRLRPDVAGALKRASLERELSGEAIFTQQDIVEQALEPWLRREGFLS